jgi:signal transduction histidine kinase
MNALLETLVTISKLEALHNLPTKLIDLSMYTKTTIDDLQKIYAKKNITIKKHISNDVIIQTHKDSWNIIIKNILENAFKFTPNE